MFSTVINNTRQTLAATFSAFLKDKAMRLAAALAFYSIFSLAPVLVILVVVAGFIWGEKAVRGELVDQFSVAVGPDAAQQIQSIIAAARNTEGSTLATLGGILLLIVASTGVFSQLRDALNTVWNVKAKSQGAVWAFIKNRLMALGVVLIIALLFAAMVVASTILSALSERVEFSVPLPFSSMRIIEFVLSFAVASVLFAAIFKWLPDVHLRWRGIWQGAIATALLFNLGKLALGWYLGRGSVASVYGAAGSLVVILLWIYYSSIIFLFGAELTQVLARRYGQRPSPKAEASPLQADDRSEQGMERSEHDEPHQPNSSPSRPLATTAPTSHASEHAHAQRTRSNHNPTDRLVEDIGRALLDYVASLVIDRLRHSNRTGPSAKDAAHRSASHRSRPDCASAQASPDRSTSTSAV